MNRRADILCAFYLAIEHLIQGICYSGRADKFIIQGTVAIGYASADTRGDVDRYDSGGERT